MCRIRRVPPTRDQCFAPLKGHVHWDHCTYFRLLVLTMAVMGGRRHVATRYRDLEAEHHRTRCNHFFLVARWAPEAALRQQAQAWRRALQPGQGETLDVIIDDAKQATWGQAMDGGATMQDPTTDASIRGHHDVCGTLLFRPYGIPWGIRLSVTQEACAAVGVPCQKTTPLAAHLMRAFQAPVGGKGLVVCDADDLGPTVVQACREQRCHVASTRKSHRSLCKLGWTRAVGRDGRHPGRRRCTALLGLTTPHGSARYRFLDTGWLQVGTLGARPVVFSRTGAARTILGLVTDDPDLSAADVIRTYDTRWTIAQGVKDVTPRLGRGQYPQRSSRAAVIPLPLVGFASALLTHLRIARHGAQGHRTRQNAADLSTATAQDQLRHLLGEDLIPDLKDECQGQPVSHELARLRVA